MHLDASILRTASRREESRSTARASYRACARTTFAALLAGLLVGSTLAATPLAAQDSSDDAALADEVLGDARVENRISFVLAMQPIKVRMVTPRIGPQKGRTFWYMIYEIENKSDEDQDVFLAISATGDRGREYSDLFQPSVERAIEDQEKRPLWGKTDKFEKVLAAREPGDHKYSYETIRAGEKRLCVAVFNPFDPTSKNLAIRVKGLTNDIDVVTDPDGTTLLKQRVRVIHVRRPGDEFGFGADGFKDLHAEWVVETTKWELPPERA